MSNKSGSMRYSNTAVHTLPCPRDNGSMMSRPCVPASPRWRQTVKSCGITQIVCVLRRTNAETRQAEFSVLYDWTHSLCIYRFFFPFYLVDQILKFASAVILRIIRSGKQVFKGRIFIVEIIPFHSSWIALKPFGLVLIAFVQIKNMFIKKANDNLWKLHNSCSGFLIYNTQAFRVSGGHMTGRFQGLFPPTTILKEKPWERGCSELRVLDDSCQLLCHPTPSPTSNMSKTGIYHPYVVVIIQTNKERGLSILGDPLQRWKGRRREERKHYFQQI